MKYIVRAFVVALALTGAIASTQISSATTQTKVTVAKTSAFPVPCADLPFPESDPITPACRASPFVLA